VLDPIELTLRFMPPRVRQRTEALLRDFEWTWTKAVVFCLLMWFVAITFLAVIPSWWLYFADQTLGWRQTKFWLFKARDLVAVVLFSLPLGGFLMVPYYLQKTRRRLRSESESRPTGGYR
jgi:hypothetical protein